MSAESEEGSDLGGPNKEDPDQDTPGNVSKKAGNTAPGSSHEENEDIRQQEHAVECLEAGRRPSTLSRLTKHRSSRTSSLDMRRLPVDVLLQPEMDEADSVLSDDFQSNDITKDNRATDLLHRTCLRPSYTLQTQLMLSFGTINLITSVFVGAICILVSALVVATTQGENRQIFEDLAKASQGTTVRYIAEGLGPLVMPTQTVDILHEAVRDRMMGYPDQSDDRIPFLDALTNTRSYPIVGPFLPLEWQMNVSVDDPSYVTSYQEHFHTRQYYRSRAAVAEGSFVMQGACNPSVSNPEDPSYWLNCTDANNNISTGGIVAPSSKTQFIYEKSADLVPVLKALFESNDNVINIGVFFMNDGVGASVNFPHYIIPTQSTYNSTGCEWMASPNPYDASRPIGNQEMIDHCRTENEEVSSRVYNPMERGWCANQALSPDRLSTENGLDAWEYGALFLALGRAVYDRYTNEFVACTYVGIDLSLISDVLEKSKITNSTELSVVTFQEEGLLISSTLPDPEGDVLVGRPVYEVDLGLSKDSFSLLYSLVDYKASWNPADTRRRYEEFSVNQDGYLVSGYPIPPIPSAYDQKYAPEFLVIVSTPADEVFQVVRSVNTVIQEEAREVRKFTVIAATIGFILGTIVIVITANMLTSPLREMNKVASEIIKNFGAHVDDSAGEKNLDGVVEPKCTPSTEISKVVKEFNKMLSSFSGEAMARSDSGGQQEMQNCFSNQDDFVDLYKSRSLNGFQFCLNTTTPPQENEERKPSSSPFVHLGSNVKHVETYSVSHSLASRQDKKAKSSSFFIWIVAVIVVPLVVVNGIITVTAMSTVRNHFENGRDRIEEKFLDFELAALEVQAKLRADSIATLVSMSVSDLFVLTRYASWLLFGGLQDSGGIPDATTGIEQCKSYSTVEACPYVQDEFLCHCDWNDGYTDVCGDLPFEAREQQKNWFLVQSNSMNNDGDSNSNSTRYPKSKETTSWWSSITELPGFNTTSISSTETTFHRVKTGAAVPFLQLLYNYQKTKKTNIGAYIAFEADGGYLGYNGCQSAFHVNLANWSSTVDNKAAIFREELCPVGKHGYDPRCRGWYHVGRQTYLQNSSFLHVTAPYLFASRDGDTFAQSATSPLVNPSTGEHIGQVLLDIKSDGIYTVLDERSTILSRDGFPILISSTENADTIVGPGFSSTEPARPIREFVMETDVDCTQRACQDRLKVFDATILEMKAGETGIISFPRLNDQGDQELVHMAYAPVNVKSHKLLDSANFARGMEVGTKMIFSLGLAETEAGIMSPFNELQAMIFGRIRIAICLLSALILIAGIAVVYFSRQLTSSITKPTLYLLKMIKLINKNEADIDSPELRMIDTSREFAVLSETMETLHKVVRSGNIAFYAGELETAHKVLSDALRLFRRLDNKKAIGTACNNLGNTMLGLYKAMKARGLSEAAGLNVEKLLLNGIALFHEAIQLGEKAYDQFHAVQGWSPVCLDFMQHLANRYFNRGVFLLTVKDDHKKPDEILALGLRDLQIAMDMDLEVISYGEEIGWGSSDRTKKLFNVCLVRLRGLNLLHSLGYDDKWGTDELLSDALDLIRAEVLHQDNSELFQHISVTGRLQELETELMKYHRGKGDSLTAARVAIRILFEDERVFVDALFEAIESLKVHIESEAFECPDKNFLRRHLDDFSQHVEFLAHEKVRSTAHDLDSELLEKAAGQSGRRFSSPEWVLQQSSGRFVVMEDF